MEIDRQTISPFGQLHVECRLETRNMKLHVTIKKQIECLTPLNLLLLGK